METISLNEASKFSSYVEKKSPSMWAGFQTRHLRVIDGKIIAYFETDKDNTPKGTVKINDIVGLTKVDKKG
jgi:hypothetical protein